MAAILEKGHEEHSNNQQLIDESLINEMLMFSANVFLKMLIKYLVKYLKYFLKMKKKKYLFFLITFQ